MKRILLSALAVTLLVFQGCAPKDGIYTLNVLAVSDIHGRYFDSTYVGGDVNKTSLAKFSTFLNQFRAEDPDVIVIDNGDALQGDNAAYYYNFIDTESEHIFSKMARYLKYDAIIVGNHDVETGHPVYDRVRATLNIPYLAANVVYTDGENAGKPYFDTYAILKRKGLKVAVIGLSNANIKNWIATELYSGLDFLDPSTTQGIVDEVIAKENPDVVILSLHAGTGEGLETDFEHPSLYYAKTLKGVDLVICGHDHTPAVVEAANPEGKVFLMNPGSHLNNVAHCAIDVTVEDGKVVSRDSKVEIVPLDGFEADLEFDAAFRKEFGAVQEFTNKKVCTLTKDISLGDVLDGPNYYVSLLHTIQLSSTGADISFAAPLGRSNVVKAGDLIYNDMFSLYQYENQLYVIELTGKQVKDYLEYSYDNWIGNKSYLYNYDSAMGIDYKVYVKKSYGDRVEILSLSDGTPFDLGKTYRIAMTSYRASGGGELLKNGAKVDVSHSEDYIVEKYPEIRDLLYNYLVKVGTYTPQKGDNWCFVK